MKNIVIINGPNLNLLGKREPSIYGHQNFDAFYQELVRDFSQIKLEYYQSNVEGLLIDKIQDVGFRVDAIILNAGAYTHTSLAIADAIAAIKSPVIEVHISNVHAREPIRQQSIIAGNCVGSISGFGLQSYQMALAYLAR
jgi:3-dehydroquinate dehydratase-2